LRLARRSAGAVRGMRKCGRDGREYFMRLAAAREPVALPGRGAWLQRWMAA
jgi:hypothetical protein